MLQTAGFTMVCFSFFLACNNPAQQKISISSQTESSEYEDGMEQAMAQEFEKTKDPATGTVPVERLFIAEQMQQQRFAEQIAGRQQSPVPGISWTERGPDNIGGRTRALLYDLNDINGKKVWAGGVGGGLWYTNDITAATPAWVKVNDQFDNLAITSITQDPVYRNILYFSTGEGVYNVDAIRGRGIWRSLDGGVNWTRLTSTDNRIFYYVNKILFAQYGGGGPCSVDKPAVLAATRDSGIYRSVDSGQTWQKCLGIGAGGGTIDASGDLEAVYYYTYATLGVKGSGGGGIYRSCNAGKDWLKIYTAAADEERIEIAPSPAVNMSWHMYALIQGSDNKIKKIMRTDNADTVPANQVKWINKALPSWCDLGVNSNDFTRGQAWYDLIAAVDPNDWKTVYIGGVDLMKSVDSGHTFSQISEWTTPTFCGRPYVHADIHEIRFKPLYTGGFLSNELLIATDGGIFRSTNAGGSFVDRNKSYNVTQYYGCAIHPNPTNYFLAGAQDNGSQKFTGAGINATTTVSGGDGGFCHIDKNQPDTQITSYVNNQYFVSTNGGTSFAQRFKNERGSFINPTDYDNTDNILYGADDPGKYYRWTNPAGNGADEAVSVPEFNGARVTHVKVSTHIAHRVYFGLNNGSIVQVDGADVGSAKTGTVIKTTAGNPSVSCIDIDPADENHLLVCYSNYGIISVYEYLPGPGGILNWVSLDVSGNTGSLPDMPVRWCMFDPRSNDWAILATELGIWSTDNLNGAATDWQPTNNNFAKTRVDMLKYRSSDRTLLAATHGRGLFSSIVPAGSPLPVSLIDFTGSLRNHEAWLDWKTVYERNTKRFEVERSIDGIIFRKIGVVNAAGNSNSIVSYSFKDKYLISEVNYYRLRMIDIDDKFEYSRVITIRDPLFSQPVFKVLKNPFDQSLDIRTSNINNSKGTIQLIDMNGKKVLQWMGEINANSEIHISTAGKNLAKGIYTLLLVADNRKYSIKLVKQ